MLPVYLFALIAIATGLFAVVEGLSLGAGLANDGMGLTLSSLGPSVSGACAAGAAGRASLPPRRAPSR